MRIVLSAVAILVVLGTAALRYGFTRGELTEWAAGRMPYPGAGFSAYDSFHLYRGGRFQLRILSPCTDKERDDVVEDVAATDLHVSVRGSHGFRLEKVVTNVRVGAWSAAGRTFGPGEVWVLPPGQYEIRITGRNPPPAVFRDRGAVIYFQRMEPVGPDFFIELSKSVGYVLLTGAAVAAVVLAVREPLMR